MRGLAIGFGLAATLLISSPAFASADWPSVSSSTLNIVDSVPGPQPLQPATTDPNVIDGTLHGDTTILPKDQLGGVYLRRDEVVHDPNSITGDPQPVIPPTKKVIKALVDSKTVVTGSFLQRKDALSPSKVVASTKTTYTYLLEGGGHIVLDSKIQNVKDLRNWVLQHPKQARMLAFEMRWYNRTKWLTTPLSIIVNALIIRG